MKVGLIDVDGHTKKKKWGATIYPNLALGKLARWHKERGDDVEWAQPIFGEYDVIYASKIFNFTPDFNRLEYHADKIIFGGTGYDIHSKLPADVDRLQPDYSIFPNLPKDTAYGFLTRGCPNKCKWCVVPRKEGAIHPYMDVDDIAIEGRNKLVLMDNNILAAGEYAIAQMEKIIAKGYKVDFNQALDARLMTDDFARLLARMKWIDNRIRFGCDTHAQIAECERAMQMINSHGYKGQYFLYTMIGGWGTNFKECYERVHYWWERNHAIRAQHKGNAIYPYAQPYRDTDNANTQIPMWQLDMARWVNKKMVFETTDFASFEPRKGFRCVEYLNDVTLSL